MQKPNRTLLILITKRGKPMARLVPADELDMHLCDAKGWLENSDPFFDIIDRIILDRSKHVPRMLKEIPATFQESRA